MAEESSALDTLLGACLLAVTGGMLDAICYLNHGHVFACAMTGNVVLMAIAALARDWMQVARHMALLVAFFFGVWGSMFLRARRALLIAVGLEFAALVVCGAIPDGVQTLWFTAAIAFFASVQSATFRKAGKYSYNSTFVTGNLRMAAEGFYEWLFPGAGAAREGADKAWDLGAICLAFLVGALSGSWMAPRFGNRSFWVVALVVGIAAGVLVRMGKAREV